MSDEIEVGSVLAGQVERIPAYPDDEIGLVGTLLAEAVQARGTGKVTVADAYLAPDGCAALDGHRQKFRVWVGHDGWKGAQPCQDAKSLIFLMPSWTSFWLGPIPRRPLIQTAFSTA